MNALASLCTGYGGLDLAAEAVLGAEPAFVADTDPGAAAILAARFPGIPNIGDITAAGWSSLGAIDVLTAGFPCQDVSCAGARKGLRAGTRTGVWSHVAEAIGALRPSLVFLENVRGLLSAGADSEMEPCPWCLGDSGDESALRALGAVLGDLADLGLDAEWQVVSAAEAGAPHRRERVFVLAWPAADAQGDGRHQGRPESAGIVGRPDAAVGSDGAAADADSGLAHAELHSEPCEPGLGTSQRVDPRGRVLDWGPYGPAVARWEAVLGRPAPRPTEPGKTGERLSPAFVEWMMGLPGGWVTGVPGLSRNAMLKALGNGVVPQQAALALRLLLARCPLREAA